MKAKNIPGSLRLQSTIIAVCSLLGAASASAQFIYTAPAAGTGGTDLWSAGTNWSAVPVSGIGTELTFGGSLNTAVAVTTQNDVANPFPLNKLTFNAAGPGAGSSPTYNITGSQLEFLNNAGATAPGIVLNATGGARKPKLVVANTILLSNDLTISALTADTTNTTTTTAATFTGVISGNVNLNIDGPGTVILTNTGNTFGGTGRTITVSGGGFVGYSSNSSFNMFGSTSNKLVLDGGGLLFHNPSNDATVSFTRAIDLGTAGVNTIRTQAAGTRGIALNSSITGNGGFTTAGSSGPLLIQKVDGTTTMGGTVTSAASTIRVVGNNTRDALGSAALKFSGGNFVFGGGATAESAATRIADFTRTIDVSSNGSLSASNFYTFSHTGSLTGAADLTINGTATNFFGTFVNTVRVQGSNSKVALSGDLSGFTGSVSVAAGTLLVGESLASNTTLTGASGKTVTVSSGATLGGNGIINTTTTVNAGGKLSAGTSAGSLQFGANLNLSAATASTVIELGGTGFNLNVAEDYDRIRMGGVTADTITLGGTLDVSLINSFILAANQFFGIFQLEGLSTRSGTFANLPNDGDTVTNIGGQDLFITYSANFGDSGAIALTGGNDIALYTVVPEPSSALLVLGGLGFLVGRRKR